MTQQLTPNYALPYYQGGDPADGAAQQQALAAKVDTVLKAQFAPITQIVPSLPGSPVDGQEVYWQVAAGVLWHMRRNAAANKWDFLGGPPITYRQEGENNAYAVIANGTNITVNAAQTKLLACQSPSLPVEMWLDAAFHLGTVQKVDAAYHYVQFTTVWAQAPAIGTPGIVVLRTQNQAVNGFEPYTVQGRWGLAANQVNQVYLVTSIQGGSWQFSQSPGACRLVVSMWPR
jgi:hypothetical protein